MKEKKVKLKLEDIKVESFLTSLDDNAANKLIGGTGGDQTNSEPKSDCCPTVLTCPATCAWTCQYSCGCPNTYATSPYMNCCVEG